MDDRTVINYLNAEVEAIEANFKSLVDDARERSEWYSNDRESRLQYFSKTLDIEESYCENDLCESFGAWCEENGVDADQYEPMFDEYLDKLGAKIADEKSQAARSYFMTLRDAA